MVTKESIGNEIVGSSLQQVTTSLQQVAFSKIDVQPQDNAYRDESELDEGRLQPLAENLTTCGLNTPLLLQDRGDNRYLLLDGHRRFFALRSLVANGVQGFHAEMVVPANVIGRSASELDTVARAISANVQRQALSAEGRVRAAARLSRLGMAQSEIARCLAVSEATIARDLALAGNDRLMNHIRHHHIAATAAATLMQTATDADRVGDLMEALDNWLAETQAAIEAEVERREASDEDPLSESQRWPQRFFSADLARSWKTALQSGGELGQPTFRFRAMIREDRGRTLLQIDSLQRDVSDMSAAELAKVFQRTVDLADALQPLVVDKAKNELAGNELSAGATASKGEDRLASLGLAHLLGSEDDEFVDPFREAPSIEEGVADDLDQPADSSHAVVEGRNDS